MHRLGRPLKEAAEGERVMLGLRVSADVKNKLDEAARKSGRSQSQEAELRLQKTFDAEELAVMMFQRDQNLVDYFRDEMRRFAKAITQHTPELLEAAEQEARNQIDMFGYGKS